MANVRTMDMVEGLTYTMPAAIIPGFTDLEATLNSSADLKVLCSP